MAGNRRSIGQEVAVEADEFTIRLHQLTGQDIAVIARELRHGFDCADGEITWWRATTAIAYAAMGYAGFRLVRRRLRPA